MSSGGGRVGGVTVVKSDLFKSRSPTKQQVEIS